MSRLRKWWLVVLLVSAFGLTAAQAVVREIQRAGGKVVALHGDVAFEAGVLEVFDGAVRALGPLDGVVVNAGVTAPTSRLVDMSVERMRRVFDVNVLGAYVCARAAARRLYNRRGGRGGGPGAPDLAGVATGHHPGGTRQHHHVN